MIRPKEYNFQLRQMSTTPSPAKLKIWSGLGTLSFGASRIPPHKPYPQNLVGIWCVETNCSISVDTV